MIYFFIFVASLLLTYLIRTYALKKSLLAVVNERSSHSVPTPHGGGIAIALTWFSGLIYLFTCNEIAPPLFYGLICGTLLSFVSYLDDVYELAPKLRLIVQALVSGLGLYALSGISLINLGFYTITNQFITNGFAFIGIMWFINLYNFLDGIDGYAGSEAVFLGLAGWFLFGGEYFLILIASVGGFLVWNWHRAKIFMGDVGSTLLGYNVAIFALYTQNNGTSILVWLILFGLFWFDATLTLFRRYKNGEKLSMAHKKHAYQRLTQSGWSHEKVVVYSICLNMLLLILGYIAFSFQNFGILFFVIAVVILYGVIIWIDMKKRFE
ncbi:MAG: glycosyltransferase family 4 protein [Sulfurospirillaceae bacterium]|nr:glycosyltransferase family 4 protein [Sulfurospirillaceae bacterium]